MEHRTSLAKKLGGMIANTLGSMDPISHNTSLWSMPLNLLPIPSNWNRLMNYPSQIAGGRSRR